MPEPSDTAAKTQPGGSLSPDEADRIAARFRPVWELDEGQVEAGDAKAAAPSSAALARGGLDEALDESADAKLAAPGSTGTQEPIDIRDTAVDGVPAVEVGATSAGRTSPDGTPPLAAAADSAKAAAPKLDAAPPSARRKKVSATKIGLGGADDEAGPRSAGARSGEKSTLAAASATSPERLSVGSKEGRSESGAARASGPVSARTASARAALDDDPVELPVEQRSKLVGWIAIAAAAAAVLIGGVVLLGGGDDTSSSTPSAKPTAVAPPETTTTSAIAETQPSSAPLGSTTGPAPTAEPSASAPAEPPTSATVSAQASSAPKATSQPVVSPAKPPTTSAPSTAKPPSTTKPPAGKPGGIIRDSPF